MVLLSVVNVYRNIYQEERRHPHISAKQRRLIDVVFCTKLLVIVIGDSVFIFAENFVSKNMLNMDVPQST